MRALIPGSGSAAVAATREERVATTTTKIKEVVLSMAMSITELSLLPMQMNYDGLMHYSLVIMQNEKQIG